MVHLSPLVDCERMSSAYNTGVISGGCYQPDRAQPIQGAGGEAHIRMDVERSGSTLGYIFTEGLRDSDARTQDHKRFSTST